MEFKESGVLNSFEIFNFDGYELKQLFEIFLKPGWKLLTYSQESNLSPFDKDEIRFYIHFIYEDDYVRVSYLGFVKNEILENPNVELNFKIFKGGSKE